MELSSPYTLGILAISSFLLSAGLSGAVMAWLRRRAIFDHPNDRSSHTSPTPRGGGLAVSPTLIVAWGLYGGSVDRLDTTLFIILGSTFLLAAVSWVDDLKGLGAGTRLIVHLAAAIGGVFTLPGDGLLFDGALPILADRAVIVLMWVWFLNAFNFMDGIDGISGMQAGVVGGGLAVVSVLAPNLAPIAYGGFAAILSGAAFGFLLFNWHPAKVFLGDVGSVPLGFLLGWLLLALAVQNDVLSGAPLIALILPAYYLTDSAITLARRAVRGEKVWRAHREHFYQRAVQRGLNHAQVVIRIAVANAFLFGCSWLVIEGRYGFAIGSAAIVVITLLLILVPIEETTSENPQP